MTWDVTEDWSLWIGKHYEWHLEPHLPWSVPRTDWSVAELNAGLYVCDYMRWPDVRRSIERELAQRVNAPGEGSGVDSGSSS
jgi:hypothetical protein